MESFNLDAVSNAYDKIKKKNENNKFIINIFQLLLLLNTKKCIFS